MNWLAGAVVVMLALFIAAKGDSDRRLAFTSTPSR
jgi:hypothetical protein